MKISERIALLRAGYTREEISAMLEEEANEIKQEEPEKAEMPTEYADALALLGQEVKQMKEAMQKQNLNAVETKAPVNAQEDVIKILGSLINPTLNKEENK